MLEIINHGAVREIRLNRPPANALNPDLILAIRAAVLEAPKAGAKALVLSGAPGMFSAGLDVPALLQLDRSGMGAVWRDFFGAMEALARSPIPVICAITGHSPAGGAVLALFCDARFMAQGKYRIGLNEVRVGLPLPEPIYRALRYAVGPHQAEWLGVSGALIDPEHAKRVGLVDEIMSEDQVVPQAIGWCDEMLRLPPEARDATRRMARADLMAAFSDVTDETHETFLDIWFSHETQGAMRALVEKLGTR